MSLLSKVEIANLAMSHLGVSEVVQSFSESSAAAKACRAWFAPTTEQALEAYNWSFARKRAALALSDYDPPDDWAFRYVFPVDAVAFRRLLQVSPDDDATPYEIGAASDGTKTILCNVSGAIGIYTFNQQNILTWTPSFAIFHSYLLAANTAIKLTGKRTLKADMLNQAKEALAAAAGLNANEEVARPPRDGDMVRARV